MGYNRYNAVALKAADAQQLLRSTLPVVLSIMTPAQIEQVQRVLDAEVVNPDAQRRSDAIYATSVVARSGQYVSRDPEVVARANRVANRRITMSERDKYVRLDFNRLLTADALNPTTDNPDETAYLAAVRSSLNQQGVWLHFDHQLVRDPSDPSRWIVDSRTFQAWLTFGYDGDAIHTKDGRITREALLSTTSIGAGYYRGVVTGPIESSLRTQMDALWDDIEAGMYQHREISSRNTAHPIVNFAVETATRTELPDISIWSYPTDLLVKARELNTSGNTKNCVVYIIAGAMVVRSNVAILADYLKDTTFAAEVIENILEVARIAGKIAEVGLAITGVTAIVRGSLTVGVAAAGDESVDSLATRFLKHVLETNPELEPELSQITTQGGGSRTVLGGVKPGTSSGAGTGFHKW